MQEKDKTVKIITLDKKHEAALPLIMNAFEKAGIRLNFRSKFDSAYDGIFMQQKGLGDIYVFEKDHHRAMDILQDILQDYDAADLSG